MPTSVPVDSIWQYTVEYLCFGQRLLNTWCLQLTSGSAPITDYQGVANNFLDFQEGVTGILDKLSDCMNSQVEFQTHGMQPVYPLRVRRQWHDITGLAGTQAGAPLPINTSQTITKLSDFATRWGIGSVHLPPGDIASINPANNRWSVVQGGLLNTVALHMQALWLSNDPARLFQPVLWSPLVPARTTFVTSATHKTNPRVERRRTLGVGE